MIHIITVLYYLLQVELETRGNVLVLWHFEAHGDLHKVDYQGFPGEHRRQVHSETLLPQSHSNVVDLSLYHVVVPLIAVQSLAKNDILLDRYLTCT